MPSTSTRTGNITLGIILLLYILFGLYTHTIFLRTQPDYDFQFYEAALTKSLAGADPYDIREIGPAFLYPPQSLFVIELFGRIPHSTVRYFLFGSLNILIVLFMIRQISKHFGYSLRDVWIWFPLAFFSAPFLAALQAGQINLITGFGIVLFFISTLPGLAALGLVLASITKVTPIALLFYSFIRRDLRTILYSALLFAGVTVAAGFRYGFGHYATYFEVFTNLLKVIGLTQNSQSFEAKLWMVFQINISPSMIHRIFLLYMAMLVLLSGFLAARTRDAVPLFVILTLVITVSPNVMWYHHYVFLLPPLFIWMAWQKLDYRLLLWNMSGLLVIQIDYYFLTTGFLIHLFVQLSILRILYQQYSKLLLSQSMTMTTTG
jgi:hypothetical protein